MFRTESSRIRILLNSEDTWQDQARFTRQSQFMINTPRGPASSPERRATAGGAAARGLRDARAIGPRNAIDRDNERSTGPRTVELRGGIEDDCVGSHAPACSRAHLRKDGCRCRAAWG